jgi:hypothetical protein
MRLVARPTLRLNRLADAMRARNGGRCTKACGRAPPACRTRQRIHVMTYRR